MTLQLDLYIFAEYIEIMSKLFDFFIGSFSSLGFINAIYESSFISDGILDLLIKIFIALLGGILTTIILNILKAQFPKLFKPFWKPDKNSSPD